MEGDDDQVGNYPFFAVCQFQVAGGPVLTIRKMKIPGTTAVDRKAPPTRNNFMVGG